jgi:hypothetical protein
MVPTGGIICTTCEGSVDKQKIAAAEAVAKRKADQLCSSEKMYDPRGKRNTKTNRLGGAKAFTAAKPTRYPKSIGLKSQIYWFHFFIQSYYFPKTI